MHDSLQSVQDLNAIGAQLSRLTALADSGFLPGPFRWFGVDHHLRREGLLPR